MTGRRVRLGVIDDFNVFATGVFTPRLIQKLEEKCNYDVLCYLPKYRSHNQLIGIDRSKVRFVWGQLNYPLVLFRALRKDQRQILMMPLEQKTMGSTVASLFLVPFFLAICRLSGIKTVINLQGLFPLDEFSEAVDNLLPKTRIPKSIMKIGIFTIYYFIFKTADRVQVFAKTFGNWVLQYGNFRSKIQLVNFGVDAEGICSVASLRPEVYPSLRNRDYVLAYGYVVPRKGLDFLVDAWSEVHSKYPNALLVIAGSTSKDPLYVSELEQKISNSNLGNSVLITGYVPSWVEDGLFHDAVCSVFPYSFSDSLSGPLCTALAVGTPIVASNIGLFSDLFRQGGALLYTPRDTYSLVEALLTVLGSKAMREKLSQESKRVASSLDWNIVGEEYCHFFDETVYP